MGGRHSSVVFSAPTILRPWDRIPSTPSMLFSICIIEIVQRKITKINKKRPGLVHIFKNINYCSSGYQRRLCICIVCMCSHLSLLVLLSLFLYTLFPTLCRNLFTIFNIMFIFSFYLSNSFRHHKGQHHFENEG